MWLQTRRSKLLGCSYISFSYSFKKLLHAKVHLFYLTCKDFLYFAENLLQLNFVYYLTEYQNVKARFRAILGYAIATKMHVKEY